MEYLWDLIQLVLRKCSEYWTLQDIWDMSKYISRRGELFQFGESAWRLGGVVGILKEVRTGVTGREDLEWRKIGYLLKE